LIPSRNEIFLARTIQDILEHAEGDTEIIAVLDGAWAEPPIPQHPKVTLIHHPISIGQRAATNEAARIAKGKYLMKVDAHCAFDQGFDVKMLADMQPEWTMLPIMRNLHAFDWVCKNGHRRYQGQSGVCTECGEPTERDVVWRAKPSPQSTAYRFDNTLHFQYHGEYKKKQIGDLVETMSIQGSCFMVTRDKYFELELCDEKHGSWGQQGVEVACKTWLSGGRVIVTKKTWYAHMFRTQGGDFGFPYPNPGISKAREYSRDLFLNDKWDKAIHPLSWLIDKFAPVPDWDISKGILYYTCNTHDERIELACRKQLKSARSGYEIGCISLKPTEFGDWHITLPLERSPLSMHKQILAGLETIKTNIVFLCESDVLYHPSHFKFIPPERDKIYYNTNVWKVRFPDGHAVWTDDLQQVSGICAYREVLLDFYRKRVEQIEREGFNKHYEPNARYGCKVDNWKSEYPNLDIRHDKTLTKSKWSQDEFRNKDYAKGWKEADEVPGWGTLMKVLDII
jgi:glycosyltransferase involved in cell wall biosynthesis